MKDFIVEEILRNHVSNTIKARRGYTKPVIPAANRYPHSASRAELEINRQPWNRTMLGTSYRNAA